MPDTDAYSPDDWTGLLDACRRLTDIQHRLAGELHTLGLLTDTNHLTMTAQADQLDAHIEQVHHHLTAEPAPHYRPPSARHAT